jgi:molecular chaperone DnaK
VTPLYVGVDLGTSNSAAAVFDGKSVSVVRNRQGSFLTPSVVRIDARGNTLVGVRARSFLGSDSANTQSEFKRLMGTAHRFVFPAHGIERTPEDLSAELLRSLRQDVADQFGVAPECAVISVPALFELHQTAATAEAARRAGFVRVELIQEPIASAIAAGWNENSHSAAWMVYDLGGGTFDVSLLETREGLLRVIGHAGDNFLGGRDFDNAIVDLLLKKLAADGIIIERANPQHGEPLRRLKSAAEEAKVELTRATEAGIFIAGLAIEDQSVDIDVGITRAELESVVAPLIDRSIEISQALLKNHGLPKDALERLVLVGGPTVTPLLRKRVYEAFGASFVDGLDPMTLVAQGAALFAATVALDGRPIVATPEKAAAEAGPEVWLQYPTMTSDLSPYVVGKLIDASNTIKQVRIERDGGEWQSDSVACEADGTFAVMVKLLPRESTAFTVKGQHEGGQTVMLRRGQFSIVHGTTIGEPPLSRSIGVALANDNVRIFCQRGAPLPLRRTFVLHSAETLHEDQGLALKVPIVQGEFSLAHLCRLVGTLDIPASGLQGPLPVGSEIEVTIELDRGGELRAQARIVKFDQIFDRVALLVTHLLPVEVMHDALAKLRTRASALSRSAFLAHENRAAARLSLLLPRLDEVEHHIAAACGGDVDFGEQARRELTELDAVLAEIEADQAWPEIGNRIERAYQWTVSWIAVHGNETERFTLADAYRSCKGAFFAKDADEVRRQIEVITRLGNAAYFRDPNAWRHEFESCAARVADSTDIRRATDLVAKGQEAVRSGDRVKLEAIVRELFGLMPVDRAEQMRSYGSGVRAR